MVDTLSSQINEIENLINEVEHLTIKAVRNNLINKVANLKTNNFGNDLIKQFANLTMNDVGNDSNRSTTSDVQFQFEGNSDVISSQNLLSVWMIRIRQDELPVLVHPMKPSIDCSRKALQTPTMQEFIAGTTQYNTECNMTPWRVRRAVIDESTSESS